MEVEYPSFISQLFVVENDISKRQNLEERLKGKEYAKKFYKGVESNVSFISTNERSKKIFRLLFPYFLQSSSIEIIVIIFPFLDIEIIPLDHIQKVARLFIDDYKINQPLLMNVVLTILQKRTDCDDYYTTRICKNTINIDFLNSVRQIVKSKLSQSLIDVTIRGITVLKNSQPGLEYQLLMFHNDFQHTIEHIQTAFNIPIKSQILDMNETDCELFENKIYHSKTGEAARVTFCRIEGDRIYTLIHYKEAFVSPHKTDFDCEFVFNCTPTSIAIVDINTIEYVDEPKVGRSLQNLLIKLYTPPKLARSTNKCTCVIRATSTLLGKCNAIIVNFYSKTNNKMFKTKRKTTNIPVSYIQYFPSYANSISLTQNLYDYDFLNLVTEVMANKIDSFFNANEVWKSTLFTRAVHFCHIPLCSLAAPLMRIFTTDINFKSIQQSSPLNLQKEVEGIIPFIIDTAKNSKLRNYRELSVKTPTRTLHLAFHELPFTPRESCELMYYRDEGMGLPDPAVLQMIRENENYQQEIHYTLQDLLQGRFWVPTERKRKITPNTETYKMHKPLYLNATTVQALTKLGLKEESIASIIIDLNAAMDSYESARMVAYHFLPVEEKFASKFVEVTKKFYEDNKEDDLRVIDATVINKVSAMLFARMKRGLLPLVHGGTFTFEKDTTKILDKGEIGLITDSFLVEQADEVLLTSPFLEKDVIRKFRNVRDVRVVSARNVVFYSVEDEDYFTAINKFDPICNVIWDKTILNDVGDTVQWKFPLDQDLNPFEGTNYESFMSQYIRILSERCECRNKACIMSDILDQSREKEDTKCYIPQTTYEANFRTYFPPKIDVLLTTEMKVFLFLLDGFGNYRTHFNFSQISSCWTLQIVGNFDDPFVGFQMQEFLTTVDSFKVLDPFKNQNNALFYGMVYLLTQTTDVRVFALTCVLSKLLQSK
ncbi:hypothetical protein EIN_227340 [Entamoeba invadens IP1]|uniref:Uncharacterized protein n=1 Tax=Entamoeba invadens IP1 TaxID=370355 RepID=A0A0A1U2L8_ENTIV|nr:hypothetical protein EIN_227340 [Entamoeba invadens IP1]ELP88321.1 hypothetical protein EIN_227340 [Entamoeba invadens IP1]|eukprot:XP_004255092.1 hypothetical protein EIN_227340 [Entamoeba invadens IP1]